MVRLFHNDTDFGLKRQPVFAHRFEAVYHRVTALPAYPDATPKKNLD